MDPAAMQRMQSSQATDYAGKPPREAPAPVDRELAGELSSRMEQAAAEASWHEEAAARWRAVQSACAAALEQLGPRDRDNVPSPNFTH